jgi:hypothetical protein
VIRRQRPTRDTDRIVGAIAALRLFLGTTSIFTPSANPGMFGFPAEQQTGMTRLVGRWFGVREIVLALLALAGHGGATPIRSRRTRRLGPREREFAALNVVNDAVDAASMLATLARREGNDRGQILGIPIALAISAGWLRVLRRS